MIIWEGPPIDDNRNRKYEYIIKSGNSNSWIILRPDCNLSKPSMLEAITVPENSINDLTKILGVGPALNVFFEHEGELCQFSPKTGITTRFPVQVSLHNTATISPQGFIMTISEIGSFDFIDVSGYPETLINGIYLNPPPPGKLPFWKTGAWAVSSNQESFVVGGYPLLRIDQYDYDGTFLRSIDSFYSHERLIRLEELGLENVRMDAIGRIWATNGLDVFIIHENGSTGTLFEGIDEIYGGDINLIDYFDVDRNGHIWTRRGKSYIGIDLYS